MRTVPGRVTIDPFAPRGVLPPFEQCGDLLALLAAHGTASHPHVVHYLEAQLPALRFFALYFYSAVRVPEAIPRLMRRLHDEEPRIGMHAVKTLFAYRNEPQFSEVLEHLHERFQSPSISTRRHAARLLALFKDVSAIPALISVFARKEKRYFQIAEEALAEITKQRFGPNPRRWSAWWEESQKVPRIGWLIDGLDSRDAEIRRSAFAELRALTGLDMGYDAEASKRRREPSRRLWQEWWESQALRIRSSHAPPALRK